MYRLTFGNNKHTYTIHTIYVLFSSGVQSLTQDDIINHFINSLRQSDAYMHR